MGEITKPTQSASEQVAKMPDNILLTLARNECANYEFRKAAVETLMKIGSHYANHHELAGIVADIRKEQEARDEVEAIVETAMEAPLPALKASVTTATLFGTEYPEFSAENVAAGYWEIYHDDDCDGVITPDNLCLKCGMHPDLQSRGARKTGKDLVTK